MSEAAKLSSNNLIQPLGLAAFDSLQAEDELWLTQCYVPPTDFVLMAGWRSALIFGDVGSGKTALRLALEREWHPPDAKPTLLLVRWPMTLAPTLELMGMELVLTQVGQIMDVVVRALLLYLGEYPADWLKAPSWARHTLTWFVQRHFQGDLIHHVASLKDKLSDEGLSLLQQVATTAVSDVLYPGAPIPLAIAELVRALESIGLEGVRVVVDGLEPWLAVDAQRLAEHLEQFLCALALFEHSRFAYTMLLPSALESPSWSAGGVVRRRVDSYVLKWSTEKLYTMLTRRLSLALGETNFTLEQLGPEEKLVNWLERCGDQSPRGWLETIRPFFTTYLAKAAKKDAGESLTADQCLAVQERHPPRLFMNLESGDVSVGWRRVIDLQPGQQALLRHLYQHRGELCSREKLYRAYIEGPGGKLPDRLFPTDYAGILDNAIYRLRQVIEPDPSHPVLIVTVKGKGFRLDNAW